LRRYTKVATEAAAVTVTAKVAATKVVTAAKAGWYRLALSNPR
jgi:hypothetical protein